MDPNDLTQKGSDRMCASPPTRMRITGAHIADGSGGPIRAADVFVEDGTITAVEPPGTHSATHSTRDLTGLVLAPGFIDAHSHADNAPLLSEHDTTKILQGVTTEVVGNCGFSLAPVTVQHRDTLEQFLHRIFPPSTSGWSGFGELFTATDDAGYVTNYCPLVGHGTLRIAAMGMANAAPDDVARRIMRDALADGMAAGAFGLSSGLIYPPAVFSTSEELRFVAEVLGGDGLYATHMRDEGAEILDAIDEALRIGAVAGRTHVSHLKAAGEPNWGVMPRALNNLAAARRADQLVTHDVYPYTASSTMLTARLPARFLADDPDGIVARLTSDVGRAELHEELAATDWNTVLVATTASHADEGYTLAELAALHDLSGVDAMIRLLVREHLRVSVVLFSMHEDDLRHAMADEHTMIGSDGLPPGAGGKPHPRLYGTFPRVLGRYTGQHGVLDVAEAIRRMTSLPAETFRIPRRGRIAAGYVADLVAFDADTVCDAGDYRDPIHQPTGITWVCQAGVTVVDKGVYQGKRHGRRLAPAW